MKNINSNLIFSIGKAVFVARTRCGFTRAQLAKRIGAQESEIVRLENTKNLPSLSLLKKVASALDQDIAFGFQPKNPYDIRFSKPAKL
jgi:transcriptional regulator with XRE-family HTH domain